MKIINVAEDSTQGAWTMCSIIASFFISFREKEAIVNFSQALDFHWPLSGWHPASLGTPVNVLRKYIQRYCFFLVVLLSFTEVVP